MSAKRAGASATSSEAGAPALFDERVGAASRRIRAALRSSAYRSEGHRKAAIRRVLHESAAGLNEAEAAALLAGVRERFPDRAWSSVSSARELGERAAAAEAEVARLRDERDALRARVDRIEARIGRLLDEAAGRPPADAASAAAPRAIDERELAAVALVLTRVLSFAKDIETSLASVEETLGRGRKTAPAGRGVRETLERLATSGAAAEQELAELDRRLMKMRLLPVALLAGIQQSWKGGTVAVLDHLDPKSCAEAVSSRFPVLRDAAVLGECRTRFEAFWNQLDQNIDHFYRAVLEKVYSEKMEGPK